MNQSGYVVHVVDDEEAVRKSMAFLLAVSGFNVRLHESATAFLNSGQPLENACLVTDLRMPGLNGVELLQRLRRQGAKIPAIVVTGHGDVPMAVEAMKAGARDFIEKPFEDEVLISAIRNAAAELGNAEEADLSAVRKRFSELSEREREVMAGVVAGHANKSIAYELKISPRTVEVHRSHVMVKMGARTLPELVRMTLRAELPVH